MIQCISFNLNKLKDDRPILITRAHVPRAQVPSTSQNTTNVGQVHKLLTPTSISL
jgi:hypothetical protein